MISQSMLKDLFWLRDDGELIRKVKTAKKVSVGDVAGYINPYRGYRYIAINGKKYLAHRLVWLYIHGSFPVDMLDHIDGDKLNNRINNLREASNQQNQHNRTKFQSNNKTGFLGVCWHKRDNKFMAAIKISGKVKHLGYFDKPEQAHQAYLEAKRQHHQYCTI
jgi:hypothetical protein